MFLTPVDTVHTVSYINGASHSLTVGLSPLISFLPLKRDFNFDEKT